jgi:DNA-binding GntR family transcriptional regulator
VAPLWEAQYTIEASLATAQEARLLGIGATSPAW